MPRRKDTPIATRINGTSFGTDPRRAQLAALYRQGLANREIAARLGISKERVRQLLQRCQIPVVPLGTRRYLAAIEGREAEIVAAFLELRSDAAVAQRLSLQEPHVHRLIDARVPEADVLRRKRRSRRPRYSDQELVAALRKAAPHLPSPLGYEAYRVWAAGRQLDGRPWPGPQVITLRCGGWCRALGRAGLPANRAGGLPATWQRSHVVAAIAAAWRELGRAPSVAGYEAWRAGRAGLPSPATARGFAAGWDNLLAACYPLVYGWPGVPHSSAPHLLARLASGA